MRTRLNFRNILLPICRTLYFQPPSSTNMTYPCIEYSFSGYASKPADNTKYQKAKRYTVIAIDKDPDSLMPDALIDLGYSSFKNHYVSDNLHHWVYEIIY